MKKGWFLTISLALVLAMVVISGCAGTTTTSLGRLISSQQEGIWVNGTGEVTVVPDIATMRLGIEAQEVSVAQAQSEATEAMSRVMEALSSNGVADTDIKTQQFSIQRVTRWDNDKEEEIVIGYRVTIMVIVKIRDTAKTGTIIESAVNAGGDLTRIDSIAFSVDDPSAYQKEARDKAMADAEAKGKQLATLAGVTLGKPTYISESTQYPGVYYPEVAYKDVATTAAPPISPGEMKISLNVQITYTIQD